MLGFLGVGVISICCVITIDQFDQSTDSAAISWAASVLFSLLFVSAWVFIGGVGGGVGFGVGLGMEFEPQSLIFRSRSLCQPTPSNLRPHQTLKNQTPSFSRAWAPAAHSICT